MQNQIWSSKLQNISSSIIDFFDVFGQLPNFRVLNKTKQTSTAGFLLSVLLMAALFSYLTNEVISMLKKSQPSMIASEELIFDTSAFELNNDNFTLALSVADINNNAIEGINKYYTLEIAQCERKRIEDLSTGNITIETNCTDIPYETCNMTHFTTDLQKSYFQRIKLGSLQCINRQFLNTTPPVMQGQINAMSFKFILIHLRMCQNTTNMNTCKSAEEIETKLQSAQYNIYSSDYLLQLARQGDPLEQIITPYFSSFSATSSKKIIQYYGIVETVSDDGILFESTQTQANLKKGQLDSYSELYNGKHLIQHYIAIQSVKTNYFRSYIKLQTILAKMGGIWQIFLLVISVLFKGILYDLMLLKVASKLFSFQDKSENNLNSPKANQIEQNNNFGQSLIQQIRIISGCDKSNSKLFKQAKFSIMKSLDIVKIIRKLQRLDVLTQLLLNQKQFAAFQAVSKPQIASQLKKQEMKKKSLIQQQQQGEISMQQSKCEFYPNNQKQNILQISTILKDSKDMFGYENEINQKLLFLLEKYYRKSTSEIQSPQSLEWSFRGHDSVEDMIEPKPQEPKQINLFIKHK